MPALPEPPTMRAKRRFVVLLLSFFLLAYILPLGVRDLFVPDETRYAEIPREMIAGGDWVAPHLDGLRYFEKPVLGYWVHAGALLLLGENNFAVRFPSALAVGLSALLIYALVDRMRRDAQEAKELLALCAAIIFLSCFEVLGVGNTAVLDNLFSFFLTATIAAFFFACEAQAGSARERRYLLLAGFSCGLAFLTKGFLAFAVPVMVVAPYLIWQRRYRDLLRMSGLPIIIAVLTALPWGIAIHLKEPDFWHFFFWNEHIRRFMAPNAQHSASFWYFFLAAPGMFMPWTFLTPAAAAGLRQRADGRTPMGRLIRFSICWLVLPFLFFSVSRGKLLTYILPCFAPFAILMALGLSDTLARGKRSLFQWGVGATAALFGLLLIAFIYLQHFGFHGFHPYSQPWKAMMIINSLIFFILLCVWAFRSQTGTPKVLLFGLSPLLLFCMVHFVLPDRTLESKTPAILLANLQQKIAPDTRVISDEDTIRAVCWYLKRDDIYALGSTGELDYGFSYADAAGRSLDMAAAARLIAAHPGKVVLIARAKNIRQWQNVLPQPVSQIDSGHEGYVLWRY